MALDVNALQASLQSSLIAYTTAMNPRYSAAPHHRLIAAKLEAVAAGKIRRLMLFAPPRHGKSELVSKNFPAWFLGKYPYKKIISASHTALLAEDFGGQVRDLLAHPLHAAVFGKAGALDPNTTARGNFRTIGKGEYFAVGVGGTPIGKGADIVVIDDPIRSREEAESDHYRSKLKSWYRSSIYSRLEGDGAIVLMHQRWHEDDLAGWLLNEHGDEGWEVIDLPALATDFDDIGRVPGEALWWEKYDEERLRQIATAMGPRDFLSMYQQKPRQDEGNEFKADFLRRYHRDGLEIARSMTRYLLVDAASSRKKWSDFTAMAVIGLGPDNNYYLLDGIRDRLKLVERAKTLMELHRKWQPHRVGYEQYGQMADVEHIHTVQESENYRFPIDILGGRMKKTDRIRRLLPDMELGKWYFPEDMWKKNVEKKSYDVIDTMLNEEMLTFPVGSHDDFIDVMSRIYDMNLVWPRPSAIDQPGYSTGGPKPW